VTESSFSDRREIDRFDRDLLTYALAWAPYGAPPPEEILPMFGISPQRFYARLYEISRSYLASRLDTADRGLVVAVVNLIDERERAFLARAGQRGSRFERGENRLRTEGDWQVSRNPGNERIRRLG
jgi:hypothetical protein